MTLNEMQDLLETVKREISIKALYTDERGKYFMGATERVIGIALDHLSIVQAHEAEHEQPVAF